ncbi:MAG: nucleotidyltransferase family protein [Eubacteriales bacterium]|nr:nucleotidyltransferase family protein [Eubacteriales bacterium]
MKVVGIIAEYNPFHEGHKYQLEKIRHETAADYIVVVMSGDYVQRGMPAFLPKHRRAESALRNGADLILELPVGNAASSAEFFACGGVSLLEQLGCIDYLCFGAETDHLSILKKIAVVLADEPAFYIATLKSGLQKGLNFPAARSEALLQYLSDHSSSQEDTIADFSYEEIEQILLSPNNILAIEYLKVLNRLHSQIKPILIQRLGNPYHDQLLDFSKYPSASALRSLVSTLTGTETFQKFKANLISDNKETIYREYIDAIEQNKYLTPADFNLLIHYQLLNETAESLLRYQDFPESLANRIEKNRNVFSDFESFCEKIKSKELTQTRIQRALLHMLLNITDVEKTVPYARVLGFRKSSGPLLHKIKNCSSIPLVTKAADAERIFSALPPVHAAKASQQFSQTIHASNIYESVWSAKTKKEYTNEYQKKILIL